jgi:predicted AAA+ superfamily ATPase
MSKHFYNDNILNYFKLFSLAYICLESLGMLDESLKKRLKYAVKYHFLGKLLFSSIVNKTLLYGLTFQL